MDRMWEKALLPGDGACRAENLTTTKNSRRLFLFVAPRRARAEVGHIVHSRSRRPRWLVVYDRSFLYLSHFHNLNICTEHYLPYIMLFYTFRYVRPQ